MYTDFDGSEFNLSDISVMIGDEVHLLNYIELSIEEKCEIVDSDAGGGGRIYYNEYGLHVLVNKHSTGYALDGSTIRLYNPYDKLEYCLEECHVISRFTPNEDNLIGFDIEVVDACAYENTRYQGLTRKHKISKILNRTDDKKTD